MTLDVEVLGAPPELPAAEVIRLAALALASAGIADGHVVDKALDDAAEHEAGRESGADACRADRHPFGDDKTQYAARFRAERGPQRAAGLARGPRSGGRRSSGRRRSDRWRDRWRLDGC